MQVFGKSAWQQLQQQALRHCQHRCAVTSVPASEVPLSVVPQWRLDYYQKTIQLAELIPVCGPVEYVQKQLSTGCFDVPDDDFTLMQLREEAAHTLDVWAAIMGGGRQYTDDAFRYLEHMWFQEQGEMTDWRLLPHATDKWLAGLAEEGMQAEVDAK
jgi:hypothetical protein